jgi:hypothetical protein
MKYTLFITLVILLFASCQSKNYPAATGFNANASDTKAIQIADEVMQAMGGYKNWQNTRYFSWNFFGRRSLLWDKWTGDVRIEIPKEEETTVILVNINDTTGRAAVNGVEIMNPDTLRQKFLNRGVTIWINDSYWLVMPFKLKDSGVTLKYIGEKEVDDKMTDQLQLTFENVGETPQHKYNVYVDRTSKLVCQWDYFSHFDEEKPRFTTPWKDYKKHGKILLSGDRGRAKLSNIEVLKTVDEARFKEL